MSANDQILSTLPHDNHTRYMRVVTGNDMMDLDATRAAMDLRPDADGVSARAIAADEEAERWDGLS